MNASEAGLWWDEDNALNELTSSVSFDFGSQFHLQQQSSLNYVKPSSVNHDMMKSNTISPSSNLESVLKSKNLFINIESGGDSSISSNNNNNNNNAKDIPTSLVRRLSLS
jgi:hypothetical protein